MGAVRIAVRVSALFGQILSACWQRDGNALMTHPSRPPTVRETIERWEHRTASRIGFRDPGRPPFDRRQFLRQFWEDHPGDPRATELADAFERATKEARGNVARFRGVAAQADADEEATARALNAKRTFGMLSLQDEALEDGLCLGSHGPSSPSP